MLIICDYRAPEEAIATLSKQGKVVLFNGKLQQNAPLQGHPDLFMCQTPNGLVLAPNIDIQVLKQIKESAVPFVFGNLPAEDKHSEVARYNAVVTRKVTICNTQTVDRKILEQSAQNRIIDVRQSYCRCSTLALSDDSFITSDAPTHGKLLENNCKSILVSPKTIQLEGYNHGLFGGCGGILPSEKLAFFMGSLSALPNYQEIEQAIKDAGLTYVTLTNLPLQDVGGIFFLDCCR
jgi:hypothetical protein